MKQIDNITNKKELTKKLCDEIDNFIIWCIKQETKNPMNKDNKEWKWYKEMWEQLTLYVKEMKELKKAKWIPDNNNIPLIIFGLYYLSHKFFS